jgi:hypothetical protein
MLDLETAPHLVFCWGLWDQNISIDKIVTPGYTLCWSAKWLGKREIMFDSLKNSTPEVMLKGIYDLVNEADAVVSYNGNKFDLPTLNKDFVLHGMTPPSPYKTIDLFVTARRAFRFPSNKLEYISSKLGLGAKVEHKGMELWKGCMSGDGASWKVMERYNKQDVRLLEGLYNKLLPWIPNHPNVSLYKDLGGKVIACTRCGSTHLRQEGHAYSKVAVYKRFQCRDCGKWLRSRVNLRLPEKKQNLLVDDNG